VLQHAPLADEAVAGQGRGLPRYHTHGVHGVGELHDDGVGRLLESVLGYALDDAGVGVDEVLPAHARLAGHARGDDHDIGAGGVLPVVGADDAGVGTH